MAEDERAAENILHDHAGLLDVFENVKLPLLFLLFFVEDDQYLVYLL
jgi:hypothetical protein